MKNSGKSLKSAAAIIIVVAALIAAANFFGIGTMRSATRIGYAEHGGRQSWSASYKMLDGKMKHTTRPKDSQKTLHIEIVTESGTLSIEITDEDGNVVFDENNAETSAFDVPVSGKAVVRIDAERHKGGFSIAGEE